MPDQPTDENALLEKAYRNALKSRNPDHYLDNVATYREQKSLYANLAQKPGVLKGLQNSILYKKFIATEVLIEELTVSLRTTENKPPIAPVVEAKKPDRPSIKAKIQSDDLLVVPLTGKIYSRNEYTPGDAYELEASFNKIDPFKLVRASDLDPANEQKLKQDFKTFTEKEFVLVKVRQRITTLTNQGLISNYPELVPQAIAAANPGNQALAEYAEGEKLEALRKFKYGAAVAYEELLAKQPEFKGAKGQKRLNEQLRKIFTGAGQSKELNLQFEGAVSKTLDELHVPAFQKIEVERAISRAPEDSSKASAEKPGIDQNKLKKVIDDTKQEHIKNIDKYILKARNALVFHYEQFNVGRPYAKLLDSESAQRSFDAIYTRLPKTGATRLMVDIALSDSDLKVIIIEGPDINAHRNGQKGVKVTYSGFNDPHENAIYIARDSKNVLATFTEEALHNAVTKIYNNDGNFWQNNADPRKALMNEAFRTDLEKIGRKTGIKAMRADLGLEAYRGSEFAGEAVVKLEVLEAQGKLTPEIAERYKELNRFRKDILHNDAQAYRNDKPLPAIDAESYRAKGGFPELQHRLNQALPTKPSGTRKASRTGGRLEPTASPTDFPQFDALQKIMKRPANRKDDRALSGSTLPQANAPEDSKHSPEEAVKEKGQAASKLPTLNASRILYLTGLYNGARQLSNPEQGPFSPAGNIALAGTQIAGSTITAGAEVVVPKMKAATEAALESGNLAQAKNLSSKAGMLANAGKLAAGTTAGLGLGVNGYNAVSSYRKGNTAEAALGTARAGNDALLLSSLASGSKIASVARVGSIAGKIAGPVGVALGVADIAITANEIRKEVNAIDAISDSVGKDIAQYKPGITDNYVKYIDVNKGKPLHRWPLPETGIFKDTGAAIKIADNLGIRTDNKSPVWLKGSFESAKIKLEKQRQDIIDKYKGKHYSFSGVTSADSVATAWLNDPKKRGRMMDGTIGKDGLTDAQRLNNIDNDLKRVNNAIATMGETLTIGSKTVPAYASIYTKIRNAQEAAKEIEPDIKKLEAEIHTLKNAYPAQTDELRQKYNARMGAELPDVFTPQDRKKLAAAEALANKDPADRLAYALRLEAQRDMLANPKNLAQADRVRNMLIQAIDSQLKTEPANDPSLAARMKKVEEYRKKNPAFFEQLRKEGAVPYDYSLNNAKELYQGELKTYEKLSEQIKAKQSEIVKRYGSKKKRAALLVSDDPYKKLEYLLDLKSLAGLEDNQTRSAIDLAAVRQSYLKEQRATLLIESKAVTAAQDKAAAALAPALQSSDPAIIRAAIAELGMLGDSGQAQALLAQFQMQEQAVLAKETETKTSGEMPSPRTAIAGETKATPDTLSAIREAINHAGPDTQRALQEAAALFQKAFSPATQLVAAMPKPHTPTFGGRA